MAGWREMVRPSPDAELAARLEAGLRAPVGPRSIWVTDLLDLRPAFFRRRFQVPPGPERRARQEDGRRLHARIGLALGRPGQVELRVRRDGVVGQIDVFAGDPVEIKTTESLPEPSTLVHSRPSYIEQLAMYCALTRRGTGRLLVVKAEGGEPGAVQVFDAGFPAPEDVWNAMNARAEALREADRSDRPDGLPRCSWFQRGCEFQEAGVCGCTGSEPPASPLVNSAAVDVAFRPEVAEEIGRRLGAASDPTEAPVAERFRDLLFPRRAFFERTEPPREPAGESPVVAPVANGRDLYRQILDALETNPPGPLTREVAVDGDPVESVSCLSGRPYLLKVTRAGRRRTPGELLEGQPHYFLDLGLRCAALGRPEGWLILGYERLSDPVEQLQVLSVRFDPGPPVEELETRRNALRRAVAERAPSDLPACPGWMYSDCPYRGRCGCGPLGSGVVGRMR